MRNKFIKKLAILLLAAIFLLSMSSNSPAQKGKKGKGVPKLYKVTISINDVGIDGEVPGIETLDILGGNPPCGSLGYFYAEQKGSNLLLSLVSYGSDNPVPEGELRAKLNMWVNLPYPDPDILSPITLENCDFYHGEGNECHGEKNYPNRSPGKLYIRIFESQDYDPNIEEIMILWMLDFEEVLPEESAKGPKKHGRGWYLQSLRQEGLYVDMTAPFPEEGLKLNVPWVTNVVGTFTLRHEGRACGVDTPENNSEHVVLSGFDFHLIIERVQ